MKYLVMPATLCFVLFSTDVLAANVHDVTNTKGQPSQSCQSQPNSPGNMTSSTTSKGSPFGTTAFSATRYSGSGFQVHSSTNPKSVSQYDVACFQVSH